MAQHWIAHCTLHFALDCLYAFITIYNILPLTFQNHCNNDNFIVYALCTTNIQLIWMFNWLVSLYFFPFVFCDSKSGPIAHCILPIKICWFIGNWFPWINLKARITNRNRRMKKEETRSVQLMWWRDCTTSHMLLYCAKKRKFALFNITRCIRWSVEIWWAQQKWRPTIEQRANENLLKWREKSIFRIE